MRFSASAAKESRYSMPSSLYQTWQRFLRLSQYFCYLSI